jgi:hypothetical protein
VNDTQKRERPEGSRANAEESTERERIVDDTFADCKAISTLQAQFALLGHEMTVARHGTNRAICSVVRHGQRRTFSHVHDLRGFLAQIGDVR